MGAMCSKPGAAFNIPFSRVYKTHGRNRIHRLAAAGKLKYRWGPESHGKGRQRFTSQQALDVALAPRADLDKRFPVQVDKNLMKGSGFKHIVSFQKSVKRAVRRNVGAGHVKVVGTTLRLSREGHTEVERLKGLKGMSHSARAIGIKPRRLYKLERLGVVNAETGLNGRKAFDLAKLKQANIPARVGMSTSEAASVGARAKQAQLAGGKAPKVGKPAPGVRAAVPRAARGRALEGMVRGIARELLRDAAQSGKTRDWARIHLKLHPQLRKAPPELVSGISDEVFGERG